MSAVDVENFFTWETQVKAHELLFNKQPWNSFNILRHIKYEKSAFSHMSLVLLFHANSVLFN